MTNTAKRLDPAASLATHQERRQLTKMIMKMFRLWNLPNDKQLSLLGVSVNSRYMLQRYRQLESTIPAEQDKLQRANLLLIIYEDLYALFPDNDDLRNDWVNRDNTLLDGKPPIDIMTNEGIIGISKISRFLDLQMVM